MNKSLVISWYRPYPLPSNPDGNELFCGRVPVLAAEPHIVHEIVKHYTSCGFVVYVDGDDMTRIRLTSQDLILDVLESSGIAVQQPSERH